MIRTQAAQRIIGSFVYFGLVAVIATLPGPAQTPSVARSLITQPIDEGSLAALRGNTLPAAQSRLDRGPAPDLMPATHLMLILKRSPEQEAALQSYLESVQNPASPDYRKFLSPDEFGQRYGLSDADLAALQTWLQSHGFSIDKVNRGRTAIEFSGTVGQVAQTFHTSIHRFLIGGAEHWANTSEPLVPSALAQVVAGVSSLNDFKPRPHTVMGPTGKWDPALHRFAPELTITSGGLQTLFVVPGDAATIYDSPNSFNTHFLSSQTAYDGTGVTIGIAGTTFLNDAGPNFYRSIFGLGALGGPSTVYDGNQQNMSSTADETEAILDTEVSNGLAPGAGVVYYAAGDTEFQSGLFLAIYRAIDDNKVDILSVSYGACEAALGAAGNAQILNAWEQAAAQGITVTVSTGDSGSAGCDNANTETVATSGLAVNGLASTPYNIAVGGTDFDVLSKSFSNYVSSTDSANYTSALSYIPENPWNNSPLTNGLLAANTPDKTGSGATDIVAGGGGASSAGNGGLTGYGEAPVAGALAPSNVDAVRDIPDVSLLAANGRYGAVWAVCIGTDCSQGSSFQRFTALAGRLLRPRPLRACWPLSNKRLRPLPAWDRPTKFLYKLAQTNPSAFHQIATGNNSVYCTSGSPNCGSNSFLSGYNAGSNYNLATGLGSVDMTVMANSWGANALTPTSTTLSLDKTSFSHGTSVNFTTGVNPAAAGGDVAITSNYTSQSQTTSGGPAFRLNLSNGSATGSSSQLPGGTYNVYANYGGDSNYAGSVSQPVQVKVSPENSTVQLTAASVNSNGTVAGLAGKTIPLGTFVTLNAQPIGASESGNPTPVTDATGSILFNDAYTGGGIATGFNSIPLDSTGNAEANILFFNAGLHSVGAAYSGDLSYNASNATPVSFTVSKASSTVTITPSSTSIIAGTMQLSAALITGLPFNAPSGTGTFTFTDTTSNTVLGTTFTGTNYGCPTSTSSLCFGGVLTIAVTQLVAGNNSLVATYSGDPNYLASAPSTPAVVDCIAGCGNGTGQSLQLSFGQESVGSFPAGGSLTAVVSVSALGGFTGAINLTCSVAGQNSSDQKIPTCSFNPTQVTATSNQAVSSTLTINTTAATTSALQYPSGNPRSGQLYTACCTALATILLLGITPRRFRRRYLMVLLAIFLTLGWVTACGGGGSGSGGSGGGGSGGGGGTGGGGGGTTTPGTTADVYTVTFHAADAATGTVTAQDYFNFTVN